MLNRYAREVTRRDVLKGAAALGALPFLPKVWGRPKILIVGAGMAGLAAAHHLRRAGLDPLIIEGSSRVSGRILTVKNSFPGLSTELGAEFIDSGHDDMRHLARQFNLPLDDVESPSEHGLKKVFYFNGRRFTEREIMDAFEPVANRIAADYDAIELDDYQTFNDLGAELDNLNIPDYLDRVGARGWLKELLTVAYTTEFGLEADQQSAVNLLYLIGTDLSNGFQEFGESDQRFKIRGGNMRLTKALAAEAHPNLRTRVQMRGIRQRGATYRVDTNVGPFDADYVVLTVPFSVLRGLDIQIPLSRPKREAIFNLSYGTNAKVILGYEKRFWRQNRESGLLFTDLPIQSGWDSSQVQPGQSGTFTCFYGGQRGVEVSLLDRRQAELQARSHVKQVWRDAGPGYGSLKTGWIANPWSKGSYPSYKVGEYTRFAGAEVEPIDRVYFAGDHCTLDFQGYMNGAANNGRLAAEAFAAYIRQREALVAKPHTWMFRHPAPSRGPSTYRLTVCRAGYTNCRSESPSFSSLEKVHRKPSNGSASRDGPTPPLAKQPRRRKARAFGARTLSCCAYCQTSNRATPSTLVAVADERRLPWQPAASRCSRWIVCFRTSIAAKISPRGFWSPNWRVGSSGVSATSNDLLRASRLSTSPSRSLPSTENSFDT